MAQYASINRLRQASCAERFEPVGDATNHALFPSAGDRSVAPDPWPKVSSGNNTELRGWDRVAGAAHVHQPRIARRTLDDNAVLQVYLVAVGQTPSLDRAANVGQRGFSVKPSDGAQRADTLQLKGRTWCAPSQRAKAQALRFRPVRGRATQWANAHRLETW